MTLTLIIQAIVAVLKFPEEMRKFIILISDSPEEKRQQINTQVDAWMEDSATGGDGEEVEPPKWEK